jgi:hypothetical protein
MAAVNDSFVADAFGSGQGGLRRRTNPAALPTGIQLSKLLNKGHSWL